MRKLDKSIICASALALSACGSKPIPSGIPIVVRETVMVVVTATAPPVAPTDPAATALPTQPPAPAATTPVVISKIVPSATPVILIMLPTIAPPTALPPPPPTVRPAPTDPPPLVLDTEVPGGAYAVTILYQRVATRGLVFRVIASKKSGQKDGDGIKRVEFRVRDGQGDVVFKHTESSNPYCAFQEAGGNDCRVIPLGPGAKWHDSKTLIIPGFYALEISVRGKDGKRLDASVGFEIR